MDFYFSKARNPIVVQGSGEKKYTDVLSWASIQFPTWLVPGDGPAVTVQG